MRRSASTSPGFLAGLITAVLATVLTSGIPATGASGRALRPVIEADRALVAEKGSGKTGLPQALPVPRDPASRPGSEATAARTPASQNGEGTGGAYPRSALADRIDRLVREPGAARLKVGVRVELLGPRGGLVYECNSRAALAPASNQKLVTTAAAACMLPADFRYRTLLCRLGRDLAIIGAGDPVFGDPRIARRDGKAITRVFHEWAERLKAAGVKRIEGDLIFDDFIFDQQHVHPKWPGMFNLQSWYTAPIGGLNFNNNCVDVVVQRGPANGSPAVVTLIPNTTYCTLVNKAVTGGKGEPLIGRGGEDPITVTVSGTVSRSASFDSPFSLPIVDPGMFFASAARAVFAAEGIEVVGRTRRQRVREVDGMVPSNLQIVAIHEQSLPDVLERANYHSLNMAAEGLLRTVGAYSQEGKIVRQGSLETGRATVAKFLGSLGLGPELYVVDDGSGLSRDNRAAAVVYAAVLKHMDAHPQREVWWNSLAEAGGSEGSLKRRMRDLNGKVFAKTGHINNVSALSGYVVGPGSRRYAFSVLCNDTYRVKDGPSSAHALQDGLCRLLAAWDQ